MHIKEQRQYDYDVTILSAEGKRYQVFMKLALIAEWYIAQM
ncbi:conjugal transfer protein TraA [Orientia tsutsugamushi]|uniref:Conjugal transfer protein TraA n=1 Tax=Orientia tsutsugamushi TaxID=784 RepID=A0A2R8EZD5_ORITS|nr:conjugal transfer protein TraA [Orientia tsutsugamushi]